MKFIETHAHIYSEKFKEDIEQIIDRSKEAGIERIYMPNIDHTSIDAMLELEQKHPEYCIPMMGLHPCSVKKDFQKELYLVEEWLSKRPFVAVGEMGTDLYWDQSLFGEQKEAFEVQAKLAIKYNVPIVIHCRDSMEETIALVDDLNHENLRGVYHCFNGSIDQGNKIIDQGFYLGIGGVATFKNGGMEPALKELPLEKMILETDSPYLAPVPNRGKRNEPSYLPLIGEKIASVRDLSIGEVAQTTTNNALLLFN